MKIVIFGNGLIGSQVVSHLKSAGHDAVALGREAGIDTTRGLGVPEDDVLAFFRDSTAHLLAAEEEAGVRHHVILSIVGADRLPDVGYMRAKIAQETLVKAGPIPYSIVRSTQFFEFIAGIADNSTVDGTVHATPAHLQPIASRDVAVHLSDIITSAPLNGTVEIAGPEPLGMDELVRRLFATTGDERTVTPDPDAGYFGAKLEDATITPTPGADAWIAPTTLDQWLRESVRRTPSPALVSRG
jgi:uncharacterized protein YbjT (DUF2867 family)